MTYYEPPQASVSWNEEIKAVVEWTKSLVERNGVVGSAEQVLIAVERLREEMHEAFNNFGLESPVVLLISQELDALLNHYNRMILEIK